MNLQGLVFGLVNTAGAIEHPELAAKCRDFTVAWSRYDYHGPIVEADSVEQVIQRARERGFRYCFLQSYGNILQERWTLKDWQSRDFRALLDAWADAHTFLVAGPIVGDALRGYGLDIRYLLVDLSTHAELGNPRFGEPRESPYSLPRPVVEAPLDRITALRASGHVASLQPTMSGWNYVAESLRAGLPVLDLGEEITHRMLSLDATNPSRRASFARYLHRGIEQYDRDGQQETLTGDQRVFLEIIARQARHARRGVFLFNIEAYDDVDVAPDEFERPVSTLYSVAAGFKPNRILETHGFDAQTRVVFFDYSPNALRVKECLLDEWDGTDFPNFVRQLFERFPYPETFYHLWGDISPREVQWSELDQVWDRELARWGGAEALARHWQAYRRLRHTFVLCDLMADPSPLLERIPHEPNAVIWWSNAFFTMYGNWFYNMEDRERRYRHWAAGLAAKNPDVFLYGSDANNTNVNFIRAGEYWSLYERSDVNCLEPGDFHQQELRM